MHVDWRGICWFALVRNSYDDHLDDCPSPRMLGRADRVHRMVNQANLTMPSELPESKATELSCAAHLRRKHCVTLYRRSHWSWANRMNSASIRPSYWPCRSNPTLRCRLISSWQKHLKSTTQIAAAQPPTRNTLCFAFQHNWLYPSCHLNARLQSC